MTTRYIDNGDGSYSAEMLPGRWVRTAIRPDGEELPRVVAAPAQQGYDPHIVSEIQAATEEQGRRALEQDTRETISMADLARWRTSGVAKHLGGTRPNSWAAHAEEARKAAADPRRAGKTLVRNALAGALDTAAAPVTVPARALRAAGVPGLDVAANLSAADALRDAKWLADRQGGKVPEEAGAYEARTQAEDADYPVTARGGKMLGEAATGVLTARGAGMIRGGAPVAPLSVYYDTYKAKAAAERTLGKRGVTQGSLEKTMGANEKVRSALGPNAKELDFYIDEGNVIGDSPGAFGLRMRGSGVGAKGEFEYTIKPSEKTAFLDLVKIPKEHRGGGLTRDMLTKQVDAFMRLGLKRMDLEAAGDGLVVWPKLGFEPTPQIAQELTSDFNARFGATARTVQDIARSGPQGEAFLRSMDMLPMSTDLASLRSRLGSSSRSVAPSTQPSLSSSPMSQYSTGAP